MNTTNLEYFMSPKSIAIVGATGTPGRAGYNFVANLVKSKFLGKIYPVNPHLEEIIGIKVYSSMKHVPERVDLVIVATGQQSVLDVVSECAERGAGAVIISSAGFADNGVEGKRLQERLVDITKERGIRIIGPNTQGLINVAEKLVLVSTTASVPPIIKGRGVTWVCQTAFFYWDWVLKNPHLGLSKAIDLGNMCDVSHTEFLEYLATDPETRVIALHIEGIREGKRFMEAATKLTLKKPVIVLKTGRTLAAAEAIASHTGSLAGRDEIYDASFRQAGIIRAKDINELTDLTKTFASLPLLPSGRRVGVITFSGAAGGLAADACEEFGLTLPEFSPTTIDKLKQVLPAWARVGNPIDIFPFIGVNAQTHYHVALEAISSDPNIDAVLLIGMMTATIPEWSALEVLHEYADKGVEKPTVVCGFKDDEGARRLASLETKGVPAYSSVSDAARAIAASYARYQYLIKR